MSSSFVHEKAASRYIPLHVPSCRVSMDPAITMVNQGTHKVNINRRLRFQLGLVCQQRDHDAESTQLRRLKIYPEGDTLFSTLSMSI